MNNDIQAQCAAAISDLSQVPLGEGDSTRTTEWTATGLTIYGGTGETPRWRVTYTRVPPSGEKGEHQGLSQARPNGRGWDEVSREVRRLQKLRSREEILQQGGQLHKQPLDLRCDEPMDDCDQSGEGGPNEGSHGNLGKGETKGLHSSLDDDLKLIEKPEDWDLDQLFAAGSIWDHPQLGQDQESDPLWGLRHWEDLSSKTTTTGSTIREPYGRPEKVQRVSAQGSDLRRHVILAPPPGDANTPSGYIRRASDSLPKYVWGTTERDPEGAYHQPTTFGDHKYYRSGDSKADSIMERYFD
uniref:Uncharacterized protein n=1 Tax=uncultured prokaryote TaxID=198431 RepID=A0A0H5Q6V4_9ZZZZ|nr:hypothetical protein [uncultured prokaryote]